MSRGHQVMVETGAGKYPVHGYIAPRAYPGLAVHLDHARKWWVVTHIASGYAMLGGCDGKEEAERAAKAFARYADCTAAFAVIAANHGLRDISRSFTRAQLRWADPIVHRTTSEPESSR